MQRVTRVGTHTERLHSRDRPRDLRKFLGRQRMRRAAIVKRMGVGPRVDFTKVESGARGGLDLPLIGVDEGTHRNSRAFQSRNRVANPRFLPRDIEPAFGRHLLASLRNEHRQLRLQADGDANHFVGCGHLKVQLRSHGRAQSRQVGVLNVPTILAEVHRDAVGATRLRLERRLDRIGLVCPTRLPHRRYVVDVYAKFRHREASIRSSSAHHPLAIRPPCECHPTVIHLRASGQDTRDRYTRAPVHTFNERLADLRTTINAQGDRVLDIVHRAVDCYFDGDREKARAVIALDEEIDRVDVEIERASIPLLGMGVTDEKLIRSVLTIVKVNNELERVADCAVDIAEAVLSDVALPARIPPVFRVMANSVTGMLRDSNRALADGNAALAQQVLLFDDTVAMLKKELMKTAQEQVASGALPVDYAFRLLTITKSIERIADHSTNTCEQVIYLYSGLIVRHRPEGWSKPLSPSTSSPHAS